MALPILILALSQTDGASTLQFGSDASVDGLSERTLHPSTSTPRGGARVSIPAPWDQIRRRGIHRIVSTLWRARVTSDVSRVAPDPTEPWISAACRQQLFVRVNALSR